MWIRLGIVSWACSTLTKLGRHDGSRSRFAESLGVAASHYFVHLSGLGITRSYVGRRASTRRIS